MSLHLQLGLTLGANEIGTLISSVLLGITTVQLYMYYKNDFKDPFWIRLMVSAIWLLETIHTVFLWIYLYDLTVTNYGNPAVLPTSPWTLSMSSVFDGIIGGTVQAYFAYRVYVLSRNLILPILSWIGCVLQMGTTLAVAIVGSHMEFGEFARRFSWMITTTLASLVITDVLNTGGLCYFLYMERSRNRVKRTRAAVDKLIMWTVETGLITSISAILMLAFFLGKPGTALWISITLFYAKLYSNCLLASLNGRVSLRERSPEVLEVNVSQASHTLADLSSQNLKESRVKDQDSTTKNYNLV